MPAGAPKQDEVEERERSPKPKRTKVAPVVPMTPFRCFCMAERTF
jgi:hypothetical protein